MHQMWQKNITWHIFDTSPNLSYRKTGQWAAGTKDYNNSTFITYLDNIDLEYYNSNILYYVYYVSMVCPNVKLEIILIWLCHIYLIWKTITFYELLLSRKTVQFTECSSFTWLFFFLNGACGYAYNMKGYAIFLCVSWLTRATLLFQFKIQRP
jgi:hypothetical protein